MISISSDWQIGRFAWQSGPRFFLSDQRVNPRGGGFFTNPDHASRRSLTPTGFKNIFRPLAGGEHGRL